jgi:hypothetical protein
MEYQLEIAEVVVLSHTVIFCCDPPLHVIALERHFEVTMHLNKHGMNLKISDSAVTFTNPSIHRWNSRLV